MRHSIVFLPCFLAACTVSSPTGTSSTGGGDNIRLPGLGPQAPTGASGPGNTYQPVNPTPVSAHGAAAAPDGTPRTCNADGDCSGTFLHCVKDVPNEVGICTRECAQDSDCTQNGAWMCAPGNWAPTETKNMCILTCVLSSECPTKTSCNGGYCGTPCSGQNCVAPVCTSHAGVDCVGDAIYWFNSCGDIEDLAETCAAGTTCVFAACIDSSGGTSGGGSGGGTPGGGGGTGSDCGGRYKRCGSSTTILTMDSCGHVVDSETCSGGKECSGAICQCASSSATRCQSGKLWRLDSCGNPKYILGNC